MPITMWDKILLEVLFGFPVVSFRIYMGGKSEEVVGFKVVEVDVGGVGDDTSIGHAVAIQ